MEKRWGSEGVNDLVSCFRKSWWWKLQCCCQTRSDHCPVWSNRTTASQSDKEGIGVVVEQNLVSADLMSWLSGQPVNWSECAQFRLARALMKRIGAVNCQWRNSSSGLQLGAGAINLYLFPHSLPVPSIIRTEWNEPQPFCSIPICISSIMRSTIGTHTQADMSLHERDTKEPRSGNDGVSANSVTRCKSLLLFGRTKLFQIPSFTEWSWLISSLRWKLWSIVGNIFWQAQP